MATEPGDEDDTLELTEELEPGEADADDERSGDDDDADSNVNDEDDSEGGDEDEEEVTTVSFGDAAEDEQEGDSSVIRQLRKELREAKAKAREAEKPAAQKRELRPKPTSEDHAFDDDAYAADLEAWFKEKAEIDQEANAANERQAAIQRDWEADVARFEKQKDELALPDLDEAQDTVVSSFNLAQQAVLVKAAENPALLMYALSKAPAKLAELAKIQDVIKLAAAIAKVEGTVKVTKGKRRAPPIDTPQRGSGATPQKGDREKQIKRLEDEAEKTGNRTKLVEYKKKHGLL